MRINKLVFRDLLNILILVLNNELIGFYRLMKAGYVRFLTFRFIKWNLLIVLGLLLFDILLSYLFKYILHLFLLLTYFSFLILFFLITLFIYFVLYWLVLFSFEVVWKIKLFTAQCAWLICFLFIFIYINFISHFHVYLLVLLWLL